jgi:type VI secretion system protein ImpA
MVEFDALLQPISTEKPAGEDLRLDPGDLTFSQLEEYRTEVDPTLDAGGESRSANWPGVVSLCEETLTERTKDLEIAAFYTQGLVAVEGVSGLLTGLRILRGLVEEFWDHVHPGWDEGEIIEPIRARPLSWIGSSREFLATVKKLQVTDPIGDAARSWFDYEQSKRVDKAAISADQSAFQELVGGGLITGEQWRSSLGGTPPERLGATIGGLKECVAELAALDKACEDRFTEDPPFLMDLISLLEEIMEYLEQYASSGGAGATETAPAAEAQSSGPGSPPMAAAPAGIPASGAPAGPIASRDEAYRRLREVAEFLRKTEPHSPVPPLLDRAVRWGNMSFEKLFDDVVKNKDARVQTRDLLGLESAGESKGAATTTDANPKRMADNSPKRLNG